MSDAKPATEIKSLAGARAIPPLLLVLYHFHEGHGYQGVPWWDVLMAKGYLWVEFFFALSGFVLVYAYSARWETLFTASGYGNFVRNRLARLYPVHAVMLGMMALLLLLLRYLAAQGGYVSVFDLPNYHPDMSFTALGYNLLLIQAWHVLPHLTWNGVSWFVSVEFFLCLVFPVFLVIARGGAWRAFLLLILGYATLYNLAQSTTHGLDITYDWGIERGLADFAVGVAFAMFYRDTRAAAARLPEFAFTLLQMAGLAAFFYAIYNTGWSHQRLDFWVAPPMTLLIATIAYDRGLFAKFLASAPLRKLGEWSFGIYMGQGIWLMLLRYAEQRLYPQALAAHHAVIHVIEPAVLVAVCILWGYILFALVERPANALLRVHRRAH